MAFNTIRAWIRNRLGPQEDLPIRLSRKRIYTLPTGAGYIMFSMLLVCVISSINYNTNEALLISLLLSCVSIASLIAANHLLVGIEIISVHAEPGHAGDVVTVDVEIKAKPNARGILLLMGTDQATFRVDKDGRGVASIQLAAKQRGVWQLPRMCLATRRPLGLASSWAWVWPKNTRVWVWPELESAPAPLPPIQEGERQARNSQTQNQDVRSLRPYRHGDPIRQIAWKQSARTGATVVREYDRPSGQAIIDWNAMPAMTIEKRLSRIATWVVEAERGGRPTHLKLPGQQIGPGKGGIHKRACLDALAEMPRHGA